MSKGNSRRNLVRTTALAGSLCLTLLAGQALAQSQTYNFDLPAQSLSASLREYARVSGQQIIFTNDLVAGRAAPALHGEFSLDDALSRLLAGSGLVVERTPAGAIMVRKKNEQAATDEGAANPGDDIETVVVTGTHIPGVPLSSPTTVITQDQMRNAGQSNLGDVVRSLPMNFAGGQNPTVANLPVATSSANVTGGSSVDLRGLGPDATLTLLNGRRLSYEGFNQAVDISAIPLGAVSSIQIVPDGASAIYGSDAVGGVVNVMLKEDYAGVRISDRVGVATAGDGFQQQFAATAGAQWDSGGVIGSYQNEHDNPVFGRNRPFTAYMPGNSTLFPYMQNQSGLVSAHEDLLPNLRFGVDALYSERVQTVVLTNATLSTSNRYSSESYSVAPNVDYTYGDWDFALDAAFDHSTVEYISRNFTAANLLLSSSTGCYCNEEQNVELGGRGPLLELPAGEVKVAIGAGYRNEDYLNTSGTGTAAATTKINANRRSVFSYGELFVPLVSPEQQVAGIWNATLTAAVRYEGYDKTGSELTPKIGLTYAPTSEIELAASWGKSFKAPTLNQLYLARVAGLFPASFLGASGAPAGSTAIFTAGGNPNLHPERANTWSTTLRYRPQAISGLNVQADYFSIAYNDRVASPIVSPLLALADPVYAQFVVPNPSALAQQQAIAASPSGLLDLFGIGYNPAKVIAIVNNTYLNLTAQNIHGVDLQSDYTSDLGPGTLDLNAQATWIESSERYTSASPVSNLAGTAFNPPHWRARLGATWQWDGMTASTFLNYIGGEKDNIRSPAVSRSAMTTIDLALRYNTSGRGDILDGTNIGITVTNLADTKPPYLRSPGVNYPDYDSTNYSGIGRFVSVEVAKEF